MGALVSPAGGRGNGAFLGRLSVRPDIGPSLPPYPLFLLATEQRRKGKFQWPSFGPKLAVVKHRVLSAGAQERSPIGSLTLPAPTPPNHREFSSLVHPLITFTPVLDEALGYFVLSVLGKK